LIVIDAPATVAILLNEDGAFEHGERFFAVTDEPVVVPSHWTAEVGNALVINVRRKRVGSAQFDELIEQLDRLRVTVDPPPTSVEMSAIAHQAIKMGLTYYDAAYLHKAQAKQALLFTFDKKMRAAAAELNIPLLPS
jgi:predicted nucleic acid-binding protein